MLSILKDQAIHKNYNRSNYESTSYQYFFQAHRLELIFSKGLDSYYKILGILHFYHNCKIHFNEDEFSYQDINLLVIHVYIFSAMKEFYPFMNIEKHLNMIYSFYSTSHKRSNSLKEFLDMRDLAQFKLNYIFTVRWVSIFSCLTKLFQSPSKNFKLHVIYYRNFRITTLMLIKPSL